MRSVAGTDIPVIHVVVRIERFLWRTLFLGYVLQIDADASPCAEAAPHGVNQHVGWLQVRGGIRVACLPPFDAGQCRSLVTRTSDLDEWMHRRAPLRGSDTRCFTSLLTVVRWPRRITMAVAFLLCGELEQPLE